MRLSNRLHMLQAAAICCNWLQEFHTKVTKETKRKAEVEAQARPQTGCNLLQLAAKPRLKAKG
jgi:hypothetical protein